MSKKSVLILEDDEVSRMMYTQILQMEDLNIIEKEDGPAALDYLNSHDAPDLILMDLTFPKMSAEEFIRQLKANPNTAHIPFVLISGQDSIREKSKSLGAKSYLAKPFDLDDFVNKVKTNL
jgi:CheY-like chemotaxis protein